MKNKIKKILIGLICALLVSSTSCDAKPETALGVTLSGVDARLLCDLELVATDYWGIRGVGYWIYVDKNTGVCYLQVGHEGITVLLDADGKPIMWEGFDENTGR